MSTAMLDNFHGEKNANNYDFGFQQKIVCKSKKAVNEILQGVDGNLMK